MKRGRWQRLLVRAGFAAVVAVSADAFPLGWIVGPTWKPAQTGVAAILFVCLLGKALLDSFFYERYQP